MSVYNDNITVVIQSHLSKINHQIEIKVGFEVEYLPMFIKRYADLLKNKIVDYLILGQHFGQYGIEIKPYYEDVLRYAYDVKEALESHIFSYLAHPDHFLLAVKKWDENCIKAARIIFEAYEKMNPPLEINILGIRYNKSYLSKEFFKLSKEYKVKYVLGIDAHNLNDFKQEDIDKAFAFLKQFDIDIIDFKI